MKNIIIILLLFLIAASCRDKYEVNLPPAQTSFLVVEGTIVTNGTTKINLSRTTLLEERNILYENGAIVTIQGDNNATYTLLDRDSGRYELPFTSLDENAKYRVNIKTRDNREYLSDYVQAIKTPDIDTITWTRYNDGIEIYVNTKDPENNSPYYRFEYEETWEFKSAYKKNTIADIIDIPPAPVSVSMRYYDPVGFTYMDSIYTCWQFRNSSKILLGTTTRLSENKIYLPLVSYPKGAWEFSELYSINVKQQAISKGEYDFFQKMKKNTESLGTIFDAQPSEIKGNIKCLTDTSEKIVGFIGAASVKQKRAFIANEDLLDWNYKTDCQYTTIRNHPDTLLKYFYQYKDSYSPIDPHYGPSGEIDGYNITSHLCIDCTLRGTNKKPSYWP